jgi:selenium-binding protein 1
MEAEPERLAYTALLSPDRSRPDAIAVVDVDPSSKHYAKVLKRVDLPNRGDELHHFGWNACSSALSPLTGHPFLQRRYLIVPGMRSSRLYILDTQPDPAAPEAGQDDRAGRDPAQDRLFAAAHGALRSGGHLRQHAGRRRRGRHAGPARASSSSTARPSRCWGRWEIDRGPQTKHYDFWWNLPRDYMVSSEWALPPQFENGLVAEGPAGQQVRARAALLEPARAQARADHRPRGQPPDGAWRSGRRTTRAANTAFLGVVVDTTNLEGSIWTWYRENGTFHARKTATIPRNRRPADQLPPLLKGFGAVPPLISDIDLSLDDRFLYVACWGTGRAAASTT